MVLTFPRPNALRLPPHVHVIHTRQSPGLLHVAIEFAAAHVLLGEGVQVG